MSRAEFSAKTKAEAARRANGHCEGCTRKLASGDFHYDHIIPDQLGGENGIGNCQVLCRSCHSLKTGKQDVPTIAKAKRRERSHLGIKTSRNPMPGSRNSPFKRRMDGTTERRE